MSVQTANYNPELEEIIKPLLEFFQNLEVEGLVLDQWAASHEDYNALADITKDINAVVIAQMIDNVEQYAPDEPYKQAYIKWLKLNLVLFTAVPYWRSRFGMMMWSFATAADPHAYFPLVWEEHFAPHNWYLPGEPQRPRDTSKVSAFSLPD